MAKMTEDDGAEGVWKPRILDDVICEAPIENSDWENQDCSLSFRIDFEYHDLAFTINP